MAQTNIKAGDCFLIGTEITQVIREISEGYFEILQIDILQGTIKRQTVVEHLLTLARDAKRIDPQYMERAARLHMDYLGSLYGIYSDINQGKGTSPQ